MTGGDVVCALLGVVVVGAGLLVVTSRNVVHAGLWLVVSLGAVAGEYLVLAAAFVAWVQVLIYVGAVVVLLLFAAMMTRAPTGRSADLDGPFRGVAVVVAVAIVGLLLAVEASAFGHATVDLAAAVPGSTAAAVGRALFRSWVLPFEIASVLLLAALVGAVVLSRPEVGQPEVGHTDASRPQASRAGVGRSGEDRH